MIKNEIKCVASPKCQFLFVETTLAVFFLTGQSLKNPSQFNLGPTDQDIYGQKLSRLELDG